MSTMTAPDETKAPFTVKHTRCRCDEIPREPLFEWYDADEIEISEDGPVTKVYTIPQWVEAHAALDYLEILASQGSDAAIRWAMLLALGPEGWRAVRSPGMDEETFQKILKAVLDRVRGWDGKKAPKAT